MTANSHWWKAFRVTCIIQLVLVAFQGMLSVSGLLSGKSLVIHIIELIVYTLVFVFVYQGLSILNYNFPNIPLTPRQKRSFNGLYLVNFLLIAFLFARVINTWWVIPFLRDAGNLGIYNWFYILIMFLSSWLVFGIHLIFLAGMFRLRRLIHDNTVNSWYQQFDKKND